VCTVAIVSVGSSTSTSWRRDQVFAPYTLATFRASGFGYFLEQSTRPQTIGYSLLASPVGLAAWLLDHDTDSY
jgi:hypothetical protein